KPGALRKCLPFPNWRPTLLGLTWPRKWGDFEHFIVACLFHDIGYVRGILKGDSADGSIIDAKGNKVELPRGSSDAAFMPYRVDRSKLFVMDRVARIKSLDAVCIVNAIECTRHGAPDIDGEEGTLVRAANLLGQLGDP